MRRDSIRYPADRSRMLLHQFFKYGIGHIIDQRSTRLYLIYKDAELFQVDLESGKYVDMVPGDAGKNSNMREKEMELGPFFQGAGGVFIPLTDNNRRIRNIYRLGKALQPGPHPVVKSLPRSFQYIHNHGSGSRFTMTAAHHDPGFFPALLVNISGKGINSHSQLLRSLQFGVIPLGMHT